MREEVLVPGVFSIVVASAVAKGHYDAGLLRYEAFRTLPRGTQTDPEWLHQAIELSVSAVTNLALALELQLKILGFQHTGKYPTGHDVAILGLAFPESTLSDLRAQYSALRLDPNKPEFLTFNFRGGNSPEIPAGTWPGEAATYEEAISKIGSAYIRWRYVYEKFGENLDVSISFEHLIILVKTVNFVIGHYRGNTKVSVNSGSAAPPGN